VGDPGFEVAAFLRNPEPKPVEVLTRRLDILTRELGLDRRRTRDWCFAEAMLNACWSHEDSEERFRSKVEWAEVMLRI
jgi:streptomycin 6-kinase